MSSQTRNANTHKKHKREVFWQISFPLFVGSLLLVLGCVLPSMTVFGQGGDVAVWRDISLIWLILPLLIVSLIPLALVGGLVYGITRLMGVTPGYMLQLQRVFRIINLRTKIISYKVKIPFNKMNAFSRRIRASINRRRKLEKLS